MPSLSEAYERRRQERDLRRPAGAAVFVVGIICILVALVLASTAVYETLGWDLLTAREVAGVLGGIGVPLLFVGVITALPTTIRERSLTGVGIVICLGAIGLFTVAYPSSWYGVSADHLTFEVAILYGAGALIALWYVLSAVATFTTRNNPHGTVRVEISTGTGTEIVELEGDVDRRRIQRLAERYES